MYNTLQKGMSIVSIITFDIIEKILNFYFYAYIKKMTIDDVLHPFLQMTLKNFLKKLVYYRKVKKCTITIIFKNRSSFTEM